MIAGIVTVFYLLAYAAVDLACLALEWASAPNFRFVCACAFCEVIFIVDKFSASLLITILYFLLTQLCITSIIIYLYIFFFFSLSRPTFQCFSWHTCLLGIISCVVMMFVINPVYSSASIVLLLLLLLFLHYRSPTSSWGYISQALIFHQVHSHTRTQNTCECTEL